jgi:hypothetical protein
MIIEFSPDGHRYLVDGEPYPNVTSLLEAEGLSDFSRCTEKHRDRGTAVHDITQLIDEAWPSGVPPEITTPEGIIESCRWIPKETDPGYVGYGFSYCRYLLQFRPKWKFIEKPVASKVYRFVGTLDRHGEVMGKVTTVDIKSGEPSWSADPQVALYSLALEEMEGIRSENQYALWLWPDGKTFRCVPGDGAGLSAGISAVTLYHWRKERKLFS